MASRSPSPARPLPPLVMGLGGVAIALLVLPLLALAIKAPWGRTAEVLGSAFALRALWLSVLAATGALGLAIILGTPLAWLLARGSFRGRRLLRALVTVPMVLPPVVAGIALLTALGHNGLLGGVLDALGVSLSLTTAGAIVAATFVSAPFLVLALEAGFATVDSDLEDAARTLGASEWKVFRKVTAPGLRPAYAAGGALCFARALGEFGATITFAGNLEGRTQTAPLAVFEVFQSDPGAALLLSLLLLGFSFALISLLRARVGES